MAGLGPESVAAVLAACQAGGADAADAFGRTLDAKFQLTVGQPQQVDPGQLPAGFDGAGLAIVLQEGGIGVLALLPQSSGLIPSFAMPLDVVTVNRLNTLAQELGICLLPEANAPSQFRAGLVDHLGQAIVRSGVAAGAPLIPLTLQSGDASGQLALIWPAPTPDAVFEVSTTPNASEAAPSLHGASAHGAAADPSGIPAPVAPAGQEGSEPLPTSGTASPRKPITSYEELPNYSRSLLRIQLPVRVTLAAARRPVNQIVRLAPGSILQFGKSCDDGLVLEVGRQAIALGEAVKVNEKFGLRIKEIVLPSERFRNVG